MDELIQNFYSDLLLVKRLAKLSAETYMFSVQEFFRYLKKKDKNIKEVNNNGTIGILICKRENNFVIEYCSDDRIAVREYELV